MSKFTRSERIKKLANAIKRYRGEYRSSEQVEGKAIKWLTPPDPSAVTDIFKWLESLNHTQAQITAAMVSIDGFKNHEEFGEWMKSLS